MTEWTIARADAPDERVPFLFEDRGDIVPGYDADGRPFRAYTVYMELDGKPLYVQTEWAAVAGSSTAKARVRWEEDGKAIRAAGYNPDSIKDKAGEPLDMGFLNA